MNDYMSQPMEFPTSSTEEEKKHLVRSMSQAVSLWLCLWHGCLPLSRGRCALLMTVASLGIFVLLRLTLLDTLLLTIGTSSVFDQDAGVDQWSEKLVTSIRKELNQPQPFPYALSSDGPADRSQNGQSCAVAAILGRNGTFLEAGAYNGEDLSNTLYLEKELGWTGLLVEPDPWNYWSLRKRNRKAWSLNACLAPDTEASNLSFKQSDTMGRLASSAEVASKRGVFTKVHCYPLFAVLRAANLTKLDYLALDLEGLEMKVLQTLPWDSVEIKLLQIEGSHLDTPMNKNPNLRSDSSTELYDEFEVRLQNMLWSVIKKDYALPSSCSEVRISPLLEPFTVKQRELKEFLKEKGYSFIGTIGEDFFFGRISLLMI